jgi:peptidoglycan-associated lipoprotein
MTKQLLIGATFSTLLACAHTQPASAINGSNNSAALASAPMTVPVGAACTADEQCTEKQLCVRSHCADITKDMAECEVVRVHFEFDKAELLDQEYSLLDRATRCVKADRGVHFLITGNADDRGTEEYNLALGDRRATEVAKYMERLGVSKDQLSTVSYGKDQPLCREQDEQCWAVNRRSAIRPRDASKPTPAATR